MDYDELKRKYGGRSATGENGRSTKSAAILLVIALVIAALIYAYYFYLPPETTPENGIEQIDTTEEVLSALDSIEANDDVKQVVTVKNCISLDDSEQEWTISGCDNDVMIYYTVFPGSGHEMKVCGPWADGSQLLRDYNDVLLAIGLEYDCDPDSVVLSDEDDEGYVSVYDVCGLSLYLTGGCIV